MLHNLTKWIARATAVLGGLVLVCLIILTTLSISGRSLSKAANTDWMQGIWAGLPELLTRLRIDEIRGTYELTEAGVAFAIFAFLPICQFYGAHASVDVFTHGLGTRANRWLKALWEVILTAIVIFISLRLYEGMLRYYNNSETTLFLQFPVWWAYAASCAAAVVACLTALYCAYARVTEAITNQDILPQG